MLKRLIRGSIIGMVGMLAFAMMPAHAAMSVGIDNAEGSTVYSLPGLPEDLPGYPGELNRNVTGTASFDSADVAVTVQFTTGAGTEADPTIVAYTGSANLSCNGDNSACTWSFTVPFTFGPGTYHVVATAAQTLAEVTTETSVTKDLVVL